jgi:hypothetical protein
VAMRETAERYRGDLPNAACFLKYRTYVDDAVAGVDTQDGLKGLSPDWKRWRPVAAFNSRKP